MKTRSTVIIKASSVSIYRGSYKVFIKLGEGYNVTIMGFLGENTWNNMSHIMPTGEPPGNVLHMLLLCLLVKLARVVLHLLGSGIHTCLSTISPTSTGEPILTVTRFPPSDHHSASTACRLTPHLVIMGTTLPRDQKVEMDLLQR